MRVEELDMVCLLERQCIHAEWVLRDCVQQLAVTGVAERLVVHLHMKRVVSGQPTKNRRMVLNRS